MQNKKFLDLTQFFDIQGNNLLLLAIEKNDKETVSLLIENGYDLNHVNYRQQNALTLAYQLNDKTILKDILSRYESQFTNTIKDSLFKLLENNEMQYLSLYKLDVNKNQVYPLHKAVAEGDFALVKSLINEGSDVNALNQLGKTPLFCLTGANNFGRQNDLIELFKLFKEKGYDFTQTYKKENLSSLILSIKPTQKIFDYMYQENWTIDVYKNKDDRFNRYADLRAIAENMRLNTEQIQKLFITPLNQKNYQKVPLDYFYNIKNEKGYYTNEAFFLVLDKIHQNNWPVMNLIDHTEKPKKGDDYKASYILFEQIINLQKNLYYSSGSTKERLRFKFSDYLKDLKNPTHLQAKETQLIHHIHQKTDFQAEPKFLHNVLLHYSIEDLGIHLTEKDVKSTFWVRDPNRAREDEYKTKSINSVLVDLLPLGYNIQENLNTDKLKSLLKTGVFDIYENNYHSRQEGIESFVSYVVKGFIYGPSEKYTRYEDEKNMKKALYDLFLTMCETIKIDVEHKDSKGVSLNEHIQGYIKTLTKKEHAEQLLFSLSFQSSDKPSKKVKI